MTGGASGGTKFGPTAQADSQAAAKRNVREAIEQVSARLGNTPTICRKCYVHPQVIDSYLSDDLALEISEEIEEELEEPALRPEERKVLDFLKQRLAA